MIVAIQAIIFNALEQKNRKYYCKNKDIVYTSSYKKVFLILSCAELIILAGVRGSRVGADTEVYLRALESYKNLPHNTILTAKLIYPYDFEWGYFLITKICAWVGFSKTLFLFLIASFLYIPIFKYIYEESNYPFLSILIYFSFGHFAYSLGIFRQMIAINIMIYAIKYIQKDNIVKYLICLVFAMSFHSTAIIMLPLYWISKMDLRKHIGKILILQIALFLFGRSFILPIVKSSTEYSGYISSIYDTSGGSYKNIILLNIILLGALLMIKNKDILNRRDKLIIAQLVSAIMLQTIGYHMSIFGRIVPYYSIFLISIIPQVISRVFQYKSAVFVRTITFSFLVLLF